MISIIICSRNVQQLHTVTQNITNTIAVPFELIPVDNSTSRYSLCQAYNLGASKARYDILCFMHDDIQVTTNNWGAIVVNSIQQGYELIGVAGSKYKSQVISGWTSGNPQFDFYNVYHKDHNATISQYHSNAGGNTIEDCVVLDGVWMCCTKLLWNKVQFNEALLKGFHFYDIDFSMRCSRIARVGVTFEIDLIHASQGRFTNQWLNEAIRFHRQYKKELPVVLPGLDTKAVEDGEKYVYLYWLKRLQQEPLSFVNRLRLQLYALLWMPKRVIKQMVKR